MVNWNNTEEPLLQIKINCENLSYVLKKDYTKTYQILKLDDKLFCYRFFRNVNTVR